jgi:hypothetical protein
VSVPDGKPCGGWHQLPTATTDTGEYQCLHLLGDSPGCYLFHNGRSEPVVNLSPDAGATGVAFDRTGKLMVWGGRDGAVVVCDIDEVRRRLNNLGLGWPAATVLQVRELAGPRVDAEGGQVPFGPQRHEQEAVGRVGRQHDGRGGQEDQPDSEQRSHDGASG